MTRRPARVGLRALSSAVIVGIVLSSACATELPSSGGPDASAPGSPPATSTASALPGGWRLCANDHVGYSIGYPDDWYTTALGTEDICSQFHPSSFTIPPFSERPLTALNVVPAEQPAAPTDPTYARTLLWEDTTVGAADAIRFEEEFTGEGLYQRGTMRYGYVIDLSGRTLTVYTIASPGTASYAAWKVVVDQAAPTLT